MKFRVLISISCIICITNALIDETARIGENTKIGRGVTMKANSMIGEYSSIGLNAIVADQATIGDLAILHDHARIGSGAKIQPKVSIGMHSSIGDMATIGESAILYDFSRIGSGTDVKPKVYVGMHSSVGDMATIGELAMLYDFSNIGSGAKIEPKAYVGLHSIVGPKAFIGELAAIHDHSTVSESAVLHKYVVIPSEMDMEKGEVILPTPSSFDLYKEYAENVSDEDVQIAFPKKDGSLSTGFNKFMRHLIDDEMKALSIHCTKSNETMKPKTLSRIVSLYLIQYHGLKRFEAYVRQVKHGFDDAGLLKCQLSNEFHFGKKPLRKTLESDVKKMFIQLLETDIDSQRKDRAEGDTFCKLFEQIRSGERKISLSEREKEIC